MRHPVFSLVMLLCCYFNALAMPVRSTGGTLLVSLDSTSTVLQEGSIVRSKVEGKSGYPGISVILSINQNPDGPWIYCDISFFSIYRDTRLSLTSISVILKTEINRLGLPYKAVSKTVQCYSRDNSPLILAVLEPLSNLALNELHMYEFNVIGKFAHTTANFLVLDKAPEENEDYHKGDIIIVHPPMLGSSWPSVVVSKGQDRDNQVLNTLLLLPRHPDLVSAGQVSNQFLEAITMAQGLDRRANHIDPNKLHQFASNIHFIGRTRFRITGPAFQDLCNFVKRFTIERMQEPTINHFLDSGMGIHSLSGLMDEGVRKHVAEQAKQVTGNPKA